MSSDLQSIGQIERVAGDRIVMATRPDLPLAGFRVVASCSPGFSRRNGEARVRSVDGCVIILADSRSIPGLRVGDWLYRAGEPEHIGDLAREVHAKGGTPNALPIGQSFALAGGWRIYFNRHGAADRPWCVAPNAGGWEVAVSSVAILTAAGTVYAPKATPDDEDGRPSAWIAADGVLTVFLAGHATIGAP